MPIDNRNLDAGTILVATYKKENRTCEVVQTDDGLRYKLDSGELFTSPSSAGKAAMGGVACNGWRPWSIAGTETPKREPKAKTAKPAAKKARATKPAKGQAAQKKKNASATEAKKSKAQRTAAKVDAYGCGACGESFPTMKAATAHALTHTS